MKLAPIRNPHSKTSKVEKLSKREERTILIQKTKQEVIQKYAKKTKQTQLENSQTKKDDGFKLREKVTKDSQGIKLLQEGYLQSFIDYLYLTNETTPSMIQPSQKLLEEYRMNKRRKDHLDFSEESLVKLSEDLVQAEDYLREGYTKECIQQYEGICKAYEKLNDYETASYFYNRILEVSKEAKNIDGEAQAYMGLGICEEEVLNPFESMGYHETALEKAIDGNIPNIIKKVSQQLVRVYKNIAKSYEQKDELDRSLEYFEKCLDACKKADEAEMEAK